MKKFLFSLLIISTFLSACNNSCSGLSKKQKQLIDEKIENSNSKFNYQYILIDDEIIQPILAELETNFFANNDELMEIYEIFVEEFRYEILTASKNEALGILNSSWEYTIPKIRELGYGKEDTEYILGIFQQIYDMYYITLTILSDYDNISKSTNTHRFDMTNPTTLENAIKSFNKTAKSTYYELIFTETLWNISENEEEIFLYPVIVKYLQDKPFELKSAKYNAEYNRWELDYTADYSFNIEFEGEGNNTKIVGFSEYIDEGID